MSLKRRVLFLCLFLGIFVLIEGAVLFFANQDITHKARMVESTSIPILNRAHQLKLSSASRQAVEVMKQSQIQAKDAVTKASETGSSLTTITQSVSNINDMCSQIACSAEQQSVVTEEISQNIERINYMSQENNDNLAQVSTTSTNMSSLSVQLSNIVNFSKHDYLILL